MARRFASVVGVFVLASFGPMVPYSMAQEPDARDNQPQVNDRSPASAPESSDARAKKLAELHRLWKEANEFYAAGKPTDALERLTRYVALQRALFGDKTTSEAQALEHIATIERDQQRWAEARSAAAKALAIRETVHGPDDWHAIDTRLLMGDIELRSKLPDDQRTQLAKADRLLAGLRRLKNQGNYREALPMAEEALALRRQVLGDDHYLVGAPWLWIRLLSEELHDAKRAEIANRRALEILEAALGETHPNYQACQIAMASLYQHRGDFAKAEPIYRQVLEARKKLLGVNHADYAKSLDSLAGLYDDMGAYSRGELLYRQSLEIRKRALGEAHPEYASSLINLAVSYQRNGKYVRAEPLLRQALEIRKKALGETHPDYAMSLGALATLYEAMGDYSRAEPLHVRAVAVCKKSLGETHPNYVLCLSNLATLYHKTGDYERAEPLYKQSLEIRKKVLGEMHPDYALSLNNLATLYAAMGNYAQAEPLCKQSLTIRKKVLGELHPDYATSLSNLAMLYDAMGDYAQAEPLCREALEIRKRSLGEMHPEYAVSLNSLAFLYKEMGNYAQAEPLYRRALAIRKKVLGEAHSDYAESLHNLGALYDIMGENAQAESLHQQASDILKKVLGETHPTYAASLNALAGLSYRKGDYVRADLLYRDTLEILEKTQGETHPGYARSLSNLGLVQLAMGHAVEAEASLREAVRIGRKSLDLAAVVQSERQQLAMAHQTRGFLDSYLTVALAANTPPGEVYEQAAVWKGAVAAQQQLMRTKQRAVAADPNSDLRKLFDELEQQTRRLAAMYRYAPKLAEAEQFQKTMRRLSESIEILQQRLAQLDPDFHRQWAQRKVSANEFCQMLPADAAIVDVLEYHHYIPAAAANGAKGNKDAWEPKFVAFVVRRDRPIEIISLGPSKPIGQSVDDWRVGYGQRPTATGKQPGAELRRLVWEPLAPALEGVTTVLVSPDGALARLPWGALPGEKPDKYLIEERTLAVLPVPQLLPELLRPLTGTKTESLLLVGDVDFGSRPGKAPQLAAATGRAAPRQSHDAQPAPFFASLPGTRPEISAIAAYFGQRFPAGHVRVLCGEEATEDVVRSAARQFRYLHLATHGFFAPVDLRSALTSGAADDKALRGELASRQKVTGYHPGLLSGIVLAGANRPIKPDHDDGILTALEVAELDLSNTELAVLSACETGLGQVAGGEGVLGLQRALQTAGVRNVVTSLWQVNDQATQTLMRRFYQNLWQRKLPPIKALREAQLAMLNYYDARQQQLTRGADEQTPFDPTKAQQASVASTQSRADPFFWAAFVFSGSAW